METENIAFSPSATLEDVKMNILEFCLSPQRKEDILKYLGFEFKPYYHKKFTNRLFEDRYLQYSIPENPRSNQQKYITSKKGVAYLKSIE